VTTDIIFMKSSVKTEGALLILGLLRKIEKLEVMKF